MRQSPRLRRLRSDLKGMQELSAESSILEFRVPGPTFGGSPEVYTVRFLGLGTWRPVGTDEVLLRERHEVSVQLGASYPRTMPELVWKTPVFHPNISSNGIVCLGGYSTHWVPSLQLDELCCMLWDMIRYANFDIESPYNREAAQWARDQRSMVFPLDPRPLRDKVARNQYTGTMGEAVGPAGQPVARLGAHPHRSNSPMEAPDILFVEQEIVEAEIVDETPLATDTPDILFIE
jgi:hypothetical protein